MKILIVVLNFNGLALLKKHLPSVINTKYTDFDIVVVENGSSNNSVEDIKREFPSVKVVESSINLGFGRGNNLGVSQYPNYDAYLFLNNDVTVKGDWLSEMVEVFKIDEKIGGVGSKILYSKKRDGEYVINSAGLEIDKHYLAYDRYEGEIDSEKFNTIAEVDGLCGGALLIRKEVWDSVGGFNPHMFMYYEDVDLSLRIRDLGFKLYYCGKSTVYHDHMGTSYSLGSRKTNLMNMKNRYISIGSRLGFLIALTETFWYIFNWFVWKLIYSKDITLKEFLKKKE